ncbi:hypothetical protein BH23CHL1_BH23CHL1_12630 [soil metagenome]
MARWQQVVQRYVRRHGMLLLLLVGGQAASIFLARGEHALWPVAIPWIISLFAAVALVDARSGCRRSSRLPVQTYEILAIFGLTLLAVILRVPLLETIPSGIAGDEGEFGVLALEVSQGRGPDPFGVAFLGDPALYVHLLAPWVAALGPTMEAIRLPSALAGAATVPALYLLMREIAGRTPAALAAFLLATSAVHIHFSRLALNVIEMPLFACLSLWCLARGILKGGNVWYLSAGILGGMGFYFHFGSRLLAPVLLLVLIGQLISAPRAWRAWLRVSGLTGFGGLLALSPILAHLSSNPHLFTDHMGSRGIWRHWDRLALRYGTEPSDRAGILWEQVVVTFHAFTRQADSPFGAQFYTFANAPLLNGILATLALLGLVVLCARIRTPHARLLLIWFAVPILFASILTDTAGQAHRLIHPLLPSIVAVALFVEWVRRLGHSRLPPRIAPVVMSLLVFVPLAAGLWDSYRYFQPGNMDRFAPAQTAQALCMEALPTGTVALVVGAPRVYARHGPSRYLGHAVDRRDLNDPAAQLPIDTAGKPLVIMVHEWNRDALPQIRSIYPDAQSVEIQRPTGKRVLTVIAPPADGHAATELLRACASNAGDTSLSTRMVRASRLSIM